MKTVVVGAGFGGIAAALRARAKGHAVTVIDRGGVLGGRAQVFERNGFRHDAGPTVITAPFLFEELFQLFGKRLSDYVTMVPLDTWYRFRFDDGSTFDYGGTVEDTCREIAKIEPADVDGYLKLLETSRRIYEVGFEQLSDKPFHRLSTMVAQVPAMLRLGAYRTVWQLVCRHLRHPKLRQAFSIQPLLVGGNPLSTTSIYNLIHFLERRDGVHFPLGGTGALVAGLGRLMAEEGITVRLGTTVTGIEVADGRVSSISTDDGETVPVDTVIANADPAHVYANLLGAKEVGLSAKVKTKYARKSMGLFVLYFGADRQWPDVAHHTISLGPRYEGLLKDIFDRKVLADDFSLYLHRPTATDPSFAPEGKDSFYCLCPVPNLTGGLDWSVEGPRLRDRIVENLDRTLLPGLRQTIRDAFFMTPEDFASAYLTPAGSGFSIAPHFTQSAWMRFHNKAEGPANLWFVGAGTHPGAGVPGVLSSAKVVETMLPTVAGGVADRFEPTVPAVAAE